MKCIERFNEYRDEAFDTIMIRIKSDKIISGKYAHHIKIDKKEKIKGKELFKNEK